MSGIERLCFFQILSRGGGVAGSDVLLAFFCELFDERPGFDLLARFVAEDARFVVHQIVRQDFGRDVDDALKVARRHRRARLHERVAGGRRKQRVDIDRKIWIARFLEQFSRGIEARIHLQDEVASLNDFIRASELVQRNRLLKCGSDSLFDGSRERRIAEVCTHAF